MRWISVKEDLPYEDQNCWVYGYLEVGCCKKTVFEAFFTKEYYRPPWVEEKPRWVVDESLGGYVSLDRVSHWMPYFKPEPPNE